MSSSSKGWPRLQKEDFYGGQPSKDTAGSGLQALRLRFRGWYNFSILLLLKLLDLWKPSFPKCGLDGSQDLAPYRLHRHHRQFWK
jgi:hypothetical protein